MIISMMLRQVYTLNMAQGAEKKIVTKVVIDL